METLGWLILMIYELSPIPTIIFFWDFFNSQCFNYHTIVFIRPGHTTNNCRITSSLVGGARHWVGVAQNCCPTSRGGNTLVSVHQFVCGCKVDVDCFFQSNVLLFVAWSKILMSSHCEDGSKSGCGAEAEMVPLCQTALVVH